jgi:hypothetical protein
MSEYSGSVDSADNSLRPGRGCLSRSPFQSLRHLGLIDRQVAVMAREAKVFD